MLAGGSEYITTYACADDEVVRLRCLIMRGRCGNAADAAADAQARRRELAWHAGASASTGGRVGSRTRRTCSGGFTLDGPAGKTLSILDLLQQMPASFKAAGICELVNR
jgi:hypothetical protein